MKLERPVLLLALLTACKGPTTPVVVTPPTVPEPPAGLVINEVMAANDSGAMDPASPECPEFDDWIEVVNDGPDAVSMAGVELSDGGTPFVFGALELPPGGHALVWADGQLDQGADHAPFKVSSEGETLELSLDGVVLDTVVVPMVPRDSSWARVRDGSSDWAESAVPTPGAPNHRILPDDDCFVDDGGFDDHSYPCISTVDSYRALAGDRTDLQIVKFDIFDFSTSPRIVYVDSAFYQLHDQFYLFTLFNNETFPNLPRYAPYDGDFRTWGQLDAWARGVNLSALMDPGAARFAGERLYSPYFYSSINGENRSLGVGTIVHRPATSEREEFWGFELEYADDIEYDDLVVYFEQLEATGPEPFSSIRWLVRSPEQEALAQRMETDGLPYADRVVRYSELAQPGEVEVYNSGVTAGRVRVIRAGGGGLDQAQDTDILVLDSIPDYLPPCAALITSVPQTPLSHVSLLARSRGIPNLYVAGIETNAEWDAWSRVSTRVALEATDGGFRAGVMAFSDYLRWRNLLVANVPQLDPVDPTNLPWAYDLATAPDMVTLRPLAGGKAAGMRQLVATGGFDTPNTPLGLSVRGFHAHMDTLSWLPDLLDASPFVLPNQARERFLVLEGRAAFDERYVETADQAAADQFFVEHPAGSRLGDLSRADGLAGHVASTPMPAHVRAALVGAVEDQFAGLDPSVGLRFRSSSTVEDVEGFNGAGLYTSKTGYRSPSTDQRSVADAIKAVWGSYWGAEAFEEREAAGLVHLDGGMGVLVHPRFDDDYEDANMVYTISLLPDGTHEMILNAQDGAISVANPPTTCPPVLPEGTRMTDANGRVIERLTESTEVAAGEMVLDDTAVEALFDAGIAVLDDWLDAENALLAPPLQRSVLTLDLEARSMASGWLGGVAPRLVVKQSRSLEPSVGSLPTSIQVMPAPRDLLARAADVEELRCMGGDLDLRVRSLTTDPFQHPDMGWSNERFVIDLRLTATAANPDLDLEAGQTLSYTHLDLVDASTAGLMASATVPDGQLDLMNGRLVATLGAGTADVPVTCVGQTLWASPDAFLLEFLPE